MSAYAGLAAELIFGAILLLRHEIAHHGLAARVAAALARRPVPPLTPHAAWERARLSPGQRRLAFAAAAAFDAGLGWCWTSGHRLVTLIAFGAAVTAVAAAQPWFVRASRRAAR